MREITGTSQWNDFLASRSHASFLQSWEWGEFQRHRGYTVKRLGFGEGELTGAIQAIRYPLIKGIGYWYIPHAPHATCEQFNECLRELLEERQTLFVRYEPHEQCEVLDCVKTGDSSPSTTLLLDCSQSPQELLAAMHPKTRYNIQLAERKGVEVAEGIVDEVIDLFVDVGARKGFRTQPRSYYESLLRSLPVFEGDRRVAALSLYTARQDNRLIGAMIVITFGDTATYVFGGSDKAYRDVMAPYALQWVAITDAHSRGCQWYDFWGIAPSDDARHPWAGITRFKKGFGGIVQSSPGTYDCTRSPFMYHGYRVARFIRRMLGGAQNV